MIDRSLFAKRSLGIANSVTVGLADKVSIMKMGGADIIGLNEGELDFETPIEIIQGTIKALNSGSTMYSWLNGEPLLKDLICEKLQRENSINSQPDSILIGNGSKQVIYEIIQTLVETGDEVIIPVPCWATYVECVKLANGIPVLVECLGKDIDVYKIKQSVTDKTKLIIINSPNNPTGAVYSPESLRCLLKFFDEKGIFVLSDEAYERIVFDGEVHTSLASLYSSEYIMTVQSFSKAFSMTGYRIGYVFGDNGIIERLSSLHSHLTDNVCTFAQYGAIAALQMDQGIFKERLNLLEQRRDVAYKITSEMFECSKPKGAFYLFPNVSKYLNEDITSSIELCDHILDKAGVALIPGEACLMEGHLRISYAASLNCIEQAFERLEKILR